MISRFGLVKKSLTLTPDEFLVYWRGVHGPLAAKLPGLHAYFQHRVDRSRTDYALPEDVRWQLDGFSELQFESIEDMRRALASPEFGPTVGDVGIFLSSVLLVACEKFPSLETPALTTPAVKQVAILSRNPNLTPDEFRDQWLKEKPDLRRISGLLGYTQNVVVERYSAMAEIADYSAVPVDGIAEFWFQSEEDALAFQSHGSAPSRLIYGSHVAAVATLPVATTQIA